MLEAREIESWLSKGGLVFDKMSSREGVGRVRERVGKVRERAGQRGVGDRGLEEVGGALAGALEGERVGVNALKRSEDFLYSLTFSDICQPVYACGMKVIHVSNGKETWEVEDRLVKHVFCVSTHGDGECR